MSKRSLAWIVAGCVGLLAVVGAAWAIFGTHTLSFTESTIQARLNQQLPRTVREVTIDRVTVRLADNRLALRIEIQGTVLRQPISAVVSGRGVPRYEAQGGEMFFDADDVKVEQLNVAGRSVVGEDETAARRRLSEAAGPAVQRLAETAIKSYLATRPVYRFKDDFKGFVLKAALVDVKIADNVLVVTFSLWNLTVTAALFALALLFALAFMGFLIRHPEWGVQEIGHVADIG
jgi:hypothetical protein